jgi:ParB family transcriptional regulator, chromosome partitioning protein
LSEFKSVTDFRRIKQYISVARASGKSDLIGQKLYEFVYDDKLGVSHLEIDVARIHRQANSLARTVSRIADELRALDVREFFGEQELWEQLEHLMRVIQRQLAAADRRI